VIADLLSEDKVVSKTEEETDMTEMIEEVTEIEIEEVIEAETDTAKAVAEVVVEAAAMTGETRREIETILTDDVSLNIKNIADSNTYYHSFILSFHFISFIQ